MVSEEIDKNHNSVHNTIFTGQWERGNGQSTATFEFYWGECMYEFKIYWGGAKNAPPPSPGFLTLHL